ncbi:MAG: hypothetical protein PHF00_10795 [Elusimicrobia bacterium]|nr:hypothetical protein [Elusimicrobiota bacterium]
MPIFHLAESYPDTWVVLDRALRVVDSGDRLDALRQRHGGGRTFCFISAS